MRLLALATLAAPWFASGAIGSQSRLPRTVPPSIRASQDSWELLKRSFDQIDARLDDRGVRDARLVERQSDSNVWAYPKDDLPPYPADLWLFQNATGFVTLANAAVRRMQAWFFSDTYIYHQVSWWELAVLGIAYVDLDQAAGTTTYQNLVTTIINNNSRGSGWMIDRYIDDQAWWGLFLVRAYEQYGNAAWLAGAKAIQSADQSEWDDTCGGGIKWFLNSPTTKNTVTNTLHVALTAKLYRLTGTASYLQTAQQTLSWWLSWAYVPSSGQIYDTIDGDNDCQPQYLRLYTYNSGIILGGLADLYNTTGNKTYLDIATNIADAAMADFNNGQGIMREDCEGNGPPIDTGISVADGGPVNSFPTGCQNDNMVFRGILASNLAYLYNVAPSQNLWQYLTLNLLSATFYSMDSSFLYSESFAGPFSDPLAGALTQANAIGLLAAGVGVNLAKTAANQGAAGGKGGVSLVAMPALQCPFPTGSANPADSTSVNGSQRRRRARKLRKRTL